MEIPKRHISDQYREYCANSKICFSVNIKGEFLIYHFGLSGRTLHKLKPMSSLYRMNLKLVLKVNKNVYRINF